jgi:hypothetical protein
MPTDARPKQDCNKILAALREQAGLLKQGLPRG